ILILLPKRNLPPRRSGYGDDLGFDVRSLRRAVGRRTAGPQGGWQRHEGGIRAEKSRIERVAAAHKEAFGCDPTIRIGVVRGTVHEDQPSALLTGFRPAEEVNMLGGCLEVTRG